MLAAGGANTGSLTGANPAMTYIDRHGNTLQITFGIGAMTNGRSIDYQDWPTIGNPWMYQPRLGNLSIYGTNRTVTYDVLNWTETTNSRPVLAAVSNRTIGAGTTLLITNIATDTDQPQQTLTFALPVAPANATIAANTGVLSWRPAVAQADSTNSFTVTATDNGTPALGATQSFTVTLNKLNLPAFAKPVWTNNQFVFEVTGDAGPDYTIQGSTNLFTWSNLFTTNSPGLPFNWTDTTAPLPAQRFYRLLLKP